MRYFEDDRLKIPKKYRKMSLEQLDKNCKALEKVPINSKKKNVRTNVKFNFENTY